jgi:hypothetical protein
MRAFMSHSRQETSQIRVVAVISLESEDHRQQNSNLKFEIHPRKLPTQQIPGLEVLQSSVSNRNVNSNSELETSIMEAYCIITNIRRRLPRYASALFGGREIKKVFYSHSIRAIGISTAMSGSDNDETNLSEEITLETPVASDSTEIAKDSHTPIAPAEIVGESGSKRDRSPSNCDDAPVQEKKAAPRERRSRFSDKPPENNASATPIDPSVAVSNIASIINAQLSGMQTSILSAQPQQPITPKEQRELFVGNVLASGVSDTILKEFLNSAMKQVGLITGPEDPIVTCRMNAKFSFIELRTPEDSKNALSLNGIPFMGQCLKISRPSKYVGPPYVAKTWQEITGQAPLTSTQVTIAHLYFNHMIWHCSLHPNKIRDIVFTPSR